MAPRAPLTAHIQDDPLAAALGLDLGRGQIGDRVACGIELGVERGDRGDIRRGGVLPEATGAPGSATGAFCSDVSSGCAGAAVGADDGEQAASRPATIIDIPAAFMRIADLT